MSAQNPADAPVNQYTETPFDLRFYDANGNLTAVDWERTVNDRAYRYNYRNQLVQQGEGFDETLAQYKYDALGRLVADRRPFFRGFWTTHYYSPGTWQMIEQHGGLHQAVEATFVYGNSVDEPLQMARRGGADYYYHADDMGNVVALSDEDGAVVERTEYEDFGRPLITDRNGAPTATSTVGNPYMFTGRRFDPATGFYDYRTRWMDPAAGA